MNVTFDGGTAQQQAWFTAALADSPYPFDTVEHELTVAWSADPNPGMDFEEGYTENHTQSSSTMTLLNTLDDEGQAVYQTLVIHEMAHVLMAHWGDAHIELAKLCFGTTNWNNGGGTEAEWKARGLEATAECFKDCYWPNRAWDNRTNLTLRQSRFNDFLSLWCPGSGTGTSREWLEKSFAYSGATVVGLDDGYYGVTDGTEFTPPADDDYELELTITFTHEDPDADTADIDRIAEWATKSSTLIDVAVELSGSWPVYQWERLTPDSFDEGDGEIMRFAIPTVHPVTEILVHTWVGGIGPDFGGWPLTSWTPEPASPATYWSTFQEPAYHMAAVRSGGGPGWSDPSGSPCYPVPWPYLERPLIAQSRPANGVRRRNRRVLAARSTVRDRTSQPNP